MEADDGKPGSQGDGGTSDDDWQPADTGEQGRLGDEQCVPRAIPPRVSAAPRELLDLRPPRHRKRPARRPPQEDDRSPR